MKNLRVTAALGLYRGGGSVMRPVLSPYLLWRAYKGKEERRRRKERFGKATKQRPDGPLIWLHAASVGETMAMVPLIDHLLSMHINVLVTTGTITSAQFVAQAYGERLIHQYAPLDLATPLRRFLKFWRPDLAVTCESEIWPQRIIELDRAGIAQISINAQLSERAYKSWCKYPNIAQSIFSKFNYVLAQNEEIAERYRQLGAPHVRVTGNLKAENIPQADMELVAAFAESINGRPVWMALSTHENEEILAAEVHMILRKRFPDLLTFIIPRHPERSDKIALEFERRRLHYIRRTSGALPDETCEIFLGDTIGETGLFLRLCEIVFVGKSLIEPGGGHNPLEPALLHSAILSGPHVQNFRDIYKHLVRANGARFVEDRNHLAGAVNYLLNHPDKKDYMIQNALKGAHNMSGALEKTLTTLAPFLQPLYLEANWAD